MFHYPEFNPVAFSLGPLQVRWYGIMYLAAFLLVWIGLRMRANQPWSKVKPINVDDVVFYGALGAIVGGRIGYMLVYAHQELLADPLSIFTVWKGGMSFHGGLSGVLIAMWLYGRRKGIKFFDLTDAIAPWCVGRHLLRPHRQLHQRRALGQGHEPRRAVGRDRERRAAPREPALRGVPRGPRAVVRALVYTRKPRPTAAASGLFLMLYGAFRIVIEFVRVPDEQLGYLAFGWVTMGQLLSLPMVILGAVIFTLALRQGLDGDSAPSEDTPRRPRRRCRRRPARRGCGSISISCGRSSRPALARTTAPAPARSVVFGQQMRFDLAEGFPLRHDQEAAPALDHLRAAVVPARRHQRRASCNERKVSIWDEWADENGDLGPVYGKQWRDWRDRRRPAHRPDRQRVVELIRQRPEFAPADRQRLEPRRDWRRWRSRRATACSRPRSPRAGSTCSSTSAAPTSSSACRSTSLPMRC